MFKHVKGFVDVSGCHETSLSKLFGFPLIANDVTSETSFFAISNSFESILGSGMSGVLGQNIYPMSSPWQAPSSSVSCNIPFTMFKLV